MISLDNYVVVKREKSYRVLKVSKVQTCIDKLKFYFENALGYPYGTIFLVKNHQLNPLQNDAALKLEDDADNEIADEANNGIMDEIIAAPERQNIDDCASAVVVAIAAGGGTSQQITRENLHKMKKEGTSSTEIVSKLVEGCSSFKDKTLFAQEKYVARKKKKHSDMICLLKPTVRLLNEIYYRKDCEKICYLRIDNLSLLLSMANVHYGAKVVLVENCSGLLAGAVLERLGGSGYCLNLHKGDQQQAVPCLLAMNYPSDITSTFYPLPLANVVNDDRDACRLLNDTKSKDLVPAVVVEENDEKSIRRERRRKALEYFEAGEFDSLIIACRYHFLDLLQRIYPKMAKSRPFALYSPYVQPLLDCYQWLRDQGTSVNLNLTENFYRRYQVLPSRTHPEMNQNVVSGFVLSGLTVDK